MPILITPSILSADFKCLQSEVDSIESHADWLQVDVMDGHFVPNLSFGAPVIKCIDTSLPLDIHLMVSNPEDRISEFLEIGVSHITFHAEVTDIKERLALISVLHNAGVTAGIAINPETPLSEVLDVLPEVDLLLVMSVHPGFGGQKFISDVLQKVEEARSLYPDFMIQMDGGIDASNAKECISAGANNLVAGSAVFSAEDRAEAISALRS
ncbi:ribulose-phosphate 3-epimerase [Candidatus Peregrinibacteria bacterium]|jgi:ribulose-phosphate 3-epimerase|nr:ribulose-phosphate 3-epimerase [Candidatus Peregrinibacteria bacterium]MBT3598399.1 ribulose-phosphate 3-epimerase [Candidatus Peregrinibacteria bacterium]MBT4367436.1 ribulose-phosphate 3-epimerase [Candidatus Peregrinibacteria bacterium]MBT4585670.1 ribulose-phosphate 3-epimerase [Candidatus Peregrinibacteria bacterium]MBT6730436.1 ribulose-phosphate 3-epimerase [Candidatus Peregrinibacteria bacterium]